MFIFSERWEWWQYLNLNSSSDHRSGFDPVAAQGMRFLQFRNSFIRQKDHMAILRSVFRHLSRLKADMEACLDVSTGFFIYKHHIERALTCRLWVRLSHHAILARSGVTV